MTCTIARVIVSICFTLLSTVSSGNHAHAESFRCGNKLVLPGDTRMEVRRKCGEPGDVALSTLIRRASFVDQGRVHYREEETSVVPVEVWTYNLGPHRFMCRLRFVGGLVEGVETLGYGYDEASAD